MGRVYGGGTPDAPSSTIKGENCWLPARIAQCVELSTLNLELMVSNPWMVYLTVTNCLSDETLNRGPV